ESLHGRLFFAARYGGGAVWVPPLRDAPSVAVPSASVAAVVRAVMRPLLGLGDAGLFWPPLAGSGVASALAHSEAGIADWELDALVEGRMRDAAYGAWAALQAAYALVNTSDMLAVTERAVAASTLAAAHLRALKSPQAV